MDKVRNKYDIARWYLIFFFIIHIPFLELNPVFNILYNTGISCLFIWIILKFIAIRNKSIKNWQLFYISFILLIIPYINRLIFHGDILFSKFNDLFQMLIFSFVLYWNNYRKKEKLIALNLFLNTCIIINFITIILFPNGLYSGQKYDNNWFLGYKNTMIFIILFSILVEFIVSYYIYKKIRLRCYVIYVIAVLSIILTKSTTSLVVIIIWGLMAYFSKFDKFRRLFNPKFVALIIVTLTIGIVFLGIQTQFSFFIEDILDKDVTMTGRVFVWERSIECIFSNFWGYGLMSMEEWESFLFINLTNSLYFSNPHNFILYQIIMGGVIQLFFLLVFFYKILNYAYEHRAEMPIQFISLYLIVLLIEGITSSMNSFILFFPSLLIIQNFKDVD